MSNEIEDIKEALLRFRNDRDWEQFHDSKNLAIALSIEAAELNQLFLWKNDDSETGFKTERLKEELADILSYAFLLAIKHDFNIRDIILEKIAKNAIKYPVEKARGKSEKYDEL